jgi:hypothetical protein
MYSATFFQDTLGGWCMLILSWTIEVYASGDSEQTRTASQRSLIFEREAVLASIGHDM